MKEFQDQLHALTAFPPSKGDNFYLAFSAKYLPKLVSALRATSRETQHKAFSSYIQLLSLLPDPKNNPYFRKYLSLPEVAGLPTFIASSFVEGVSWLHPSGPGHICTLIIHLLHWCDVNLGDDGRASVDKHVRKELAQKLGDLMQREEFQRLDEIQQVDIERLEGILDVVEGMPVPPDDPGYYLKSTHAFLDGGIPGQYECYVCVDDDPELQCSRCKSVKYCGKECQKKDWKQGHRMGCFAMAF